MDKGKHGAEPGELSRRVEVRAAAIKASDAGVTVEEPIQSRIQTGGIKNSRGTEEGQMARKLLEGIWNEEGVGKSGATERSSGIRGRLNDN